VLMSAYSATAAFKTDRRTPATSNNTLVTIRADTYPTHSAGIGSPHPCARLRVSQPAHANSAKWPSAWNVTLGQLRSPVQGQVSTRVTARQLGIRPRARAVMAGMVRPTGVHTAVCRPTRAISTYVFIIHPIGGFLPVDHWAVS
jgi:hypothetical protein